MSKKTNAQRQWLILQYLERNPEGADIETLATAFDVSRRTMQRDLATMKDLKIPLEKSSEKFGRRVLKVFPPCGTPAALTYDEAAAFYIGRRFLAPLRGSILWQAIESGMRKIRQGIGDQAMIQFDRFCDVLINTKTGGSDYAKQSAMVDDLTLGIEEKRRVKIKYQSFSSENPEQYVIHPYLLLYHQGKTYIVGYSEKREAIRHWKLDRVMKTEVLSGTFERLPDFSPDKYRDSMFAVYHSHAPDGEPIEIEIRFDASAARYVGEHFWNKSQKIKKRNDGGAVMTLTLDNTVEIKAWILSFGRAAEVIRPTELREQIAEEVRALAEKYR